MDMLVSGMGSSSHWAAIRTSFTLAGGTIPPMRWPCAWYDEAIIALQRARLYPGGDGVPG